MLQSQFPPLRDQSFPKKKSKELSSFHLFWPSYRQLPSKELYLVSSKLSTTEKRILAAKTSSGQLRTEDRYLSS